MSKPQLPQLSHEARDVLDSYRQACPGAERRRVNLESVRWRIEAETAPPAVAAAGLAWPIGWGLASAVAAAGLVWGLVEFRSPQPPAVSPQPAISAEDIASDSAPSSVSRRSSPKVAPQPESTEAVETPVAPVAPVLRPSTPRPSVVKPPAPQEPASSDLREEMQMLRKVRASILSGALSDAARVLDDYATAFPKGAMREDAEAYRIMVHCKRGENASSLLRAFASRYPDSPHVARIEATCKGEEE